MESGENDINKTANLLTGLHYRIFLQKIGG